MRIKVTGPWGLILVVWWVHGLAVAKGFWMTVFCIFPLVSWVVSAMWMIERWMK